MFVHYQCDTPYTNCIPYMGFALLSLACRQLRSPSIVDQLQQISSLIVIPLLVIVPSSLRYPVPYACILASCIMGNSYALAPTL